MAGSFKTNKIAVQIAKRFSLNSNAAVTYLVYKSYRLSVVLDALRYCKFNRQLWPGSLELLIVNTSLTFQVQVRPL